MEGVLCSNDCVKKGSTFGVIVLFFFHPSIPPLHEISGMHCYRCTSQLQLPNRSTSRVFVCAIVCVLHTPSEINGPRPSPLLLLLVGLESMAECECVRVCVCWQRTAIKACARAELERRQERRIEEVAEKRGGQRGQSGL